MRRFGRAGRIGDVDLDLVLAGRLRPPATAARADRTSVAGILGSEQEGKADLTVLGDAEVPDHAGGEKIVLQPRVLNPGQRGRDASLEGLGQGH